MSAVTLFKSGLPDYLKSAVQDDITKSLMGGGGGIKRISIKGGSFRLYDAGQEIAVAEDRHLDVVIVAAAQNVSRTFYAKVFKEGEKIPPTCWSTNGISPDEGADAQSDKCMTCPQNVKNGDKGRPCRFNQRIAVVLANDIEGSVYQVTLPAQSIFGKEEQGKMPLQQYAKWVAGHGAPITALVTRMKFDLNSATPKLVFEAIGPLSEADYLIAKQQGETPDAKAAIKLNMSQADNVAPAAVSEQSTPAAATVDVAQGIAKTAKEVVQNAIAAAVVVEPIPEPVAKKSKPVPQPSGTKDVASLLEEWDD